MKTFIMNAKKHGLKAAFATVALTSVSAANAALPAVVGTTLTSVQTDGLALADLVWPVIVVIFGAKLLMKLFKVFGSKIG